MQCKWIVDELTFANNIDGHPVPQLLRVLDVGTVPP